MIAGLIGTIHRTEPEAVVVNVSGVLYRVLTTGRVVSASEIGEDVEVHTYMVTRADAQLLYGFLTPADLQWFETLIGVNGVGPKLALSILTRYSADELFTVIANEQLDMLTTVPGVGKRTASRILLDLRGKLPENTESPAVVASSADNDALQALMALGYTAVEAKSALGSIQLAEDATVEDQIVAALREMAKA